MKRSIGFKSLAILEIVKGLAVLLASVILFYLEHPTFSPLASLVLSHLHTETLINLILIFPLSILYALSGAYILVRFTEAFGLWFKKEWGRLLSAFSTVIYLPFEF